MSVITVSPAKTATLIQMLFGGQTRVGSRNHVLVGGAHLVISNLLSVLRAYTICRQWNDEARLLAGVSGKCIVFPFSALTPTAGWQKGHPLIHAVRFQRKWLIMFTWYGWLSAGKAGNEVVVVVLTLHTNCNIILTLKIALALTLLALVTLTVNYKITTNNIMRTFCFCFQLQTTSGFVGFAFAAGTQPF